MGKQTSTMPSNNSKSSSCTVPCVVNSSTSLQLHNALGSLHTQFLHAREFTSTSKGALPPISLVDMSVDSRETPTRLAIVLRFSKTDHSGNGCTIYIGHSGSNVCPVVAMLAYLAVRSPTWGLYLCIAIECHSYGRIQCQLCVQHCLRSAMTLLNTLDTVSGLRKPLQWHAQDYLTV